MGEVRNHFVSKMVKFLKDGKIVVLLQGRYAGKKAVILKVNEDGGKERPYGHCVVAGVAKAPLPITKSMCKPTPKLKKLVSASFPCQDFRQDRELHPRHAHSLLCRERDGEVPQGPPHRRHLHRPGCQEEVPQGCPWCVREQVQGA